MKLRDITEARHHRGPDFDEIVRMVHKVYDYEDGLGGIGPATHIWKKSELPDVLSELTGEEEIYTPIFHVQADGENDALNIGHDKLHKYKLPQPYAIDAHFKRSSWSGPLSGETHTETGQWMVRVFYVRV